MSLHIERNGYVMLVFNQLLILVSVLTLGLQACSSDGDDGEDILLPSTPEDVRVVSIDGDSDGDDVLDERYEFAYDDDGRVASVTYTSALLPSNNDVRSYVYEGGLLVSRVRRELTTTFTNENGLLTAIDDPLFGNQRFSYDASGKLAGAVGTDLFFFDDTCLIEGADPESSTPSYAFAYDSLGRLAQVEGSFADNTAIEYLANGQLGTMSFSGECNQQGGAVATFSYNSDNQPVIARLSIDDTEVEVVDVEYADGRPVRYQYTETEPGEGDIISSDTLTYNSDGLLEKWVELERDSAQEAPRVSSYTFSYEKKACVEQLSVYPTEQLLYDDMKLTIHKIYEGALRCGYLMDEL